jgi:uncharacterized protein (TIGR02145 family)
MEHFSNKKTKGSILAYSLIIMSIMIAIVATLSIATIIEKKSASSTAFSVQAYQTADSGLQLAIRKIDNNPGKTLGGLFGTCSSGAFTGFNDAGAGSYDLNFYYDSPGTQLITDCTNTKVENVRNIKAIGKYREAVRAIQVAVGINCPRSGIVDAYDNSITYGGVTAEDGKCWLDRNLGATQVATSATDANSYGWLFQWGRAADGHQITSPLSGTTSTLATSDTPGHSNFIYVLSTDPYDWRSPQNSNLWQGVSGINNPCPTGFRLPTKGEWVSETNHFLSQDSAGAFGSLLKLSLGGARSTNYGNLYNYRGTLGYYWSSSTQGIYAYPLNFDSSSLSNSNLANRAFGMAVRCVRDDPADTCSSWTYDNWGACQSNGTQTRAILTSIPSGCTGGSPVVSQSCTYVPPTCTSWTYSDWGSCQSNSTQTRTIVTSFPSGCTGGSPVLSQSCTYAPPTCTSWTYSDWGSCQSNSTQTRTIVTSSPSGCAGGSPVLSQSCTPLISCSASPCNSGNGFGCAFGDATYSAYSSNGQMYTRASGGWCDTGWVASTTASCGNPSLYGYETAQVSDGTLYGGTTYGDSCSVSW